MNDPRTWTWVGWVVIILAALVFLIGVLFKEVAFGQGYDKAWEQRAEKWEKPKWVGSFLYVYDQYRDSCWADSTIYHRSGTRTSSGVTRWTDSLGVKHVDYEPFGMSYDVMQYWTEVVHRQPTFDGFIDFLRRRYK